MRHESLLINGFFFGGPCDSSVGRQVVRNAVEGGILGVAAEGSGADLMNCVDSAFAIRESWARSEPKQRRRILNSVASRIRADREDLAQLLVTEIAKPVTLAYGEVDRAAITFDLAAECVEVGEPLPVDLSYDPRGSKYAATVELRSRGVVFGIVPYNWPLNLAAHKIAPALASGSPIIVKPSPLAPLSTLALTRIVHECGAPPGSIQAWNGATKEVGRALADPRIAVISFTGSDQVGWQLKAEHPRKHLVLECGGDAYVIVLADASVPATVKLVYTGAFAYAGQICISVQHVYVHSLIFSEFVSQLVSRCEADSKSDPSDPETICGPMIDSANADRVEAFITDAVASGGRRLTVDSRDGNFIRPTILIDVPAAARVCRDEVFGPVVVIHQFSNVRDAVDRVNGSRLGIQVGVFGAEAEGVADQLHIGGVVLNDVPTVRFDSLPYGGVRDSGIGREGVSFAIQEFSEPRSIVRRLG